MSHAVAVRHGEFGRAAIYELDHEFVPHAHREGHLIFSIGGACATALIDDNPIEISQDQAAAINPWQLHTFKVPGSEPVICLVLYIKPFWFLERCSTDEFSMQFGASSVGVSAQLRGLVRQLVTTILDDEHKDNFNALLHEVASVSFDLSWAETPRTVELLTGTRKLSDFRVRRAMQILRERRDTNVEFENLAREVGMSRPHFFKQFKKHVGVSPNIYLNTLRVEHAISVLMSSDKSVTEIAFDLGFSSQASFSRFFLTNVGIAPSEYRRAASNASTHYALP